MHEVVSYERGEIATVEEAKIHCSVTPDDQVNDTEFEGFLQAAHQWCGDYLGFPLATQNWKYTVYEGDEEKTIQFPRNANVADLGDYEITATANGPKIIPGDTPFEEGKVFQYSIPAPAASLSPSIKIALLMVVHDLYEFRGDAPSRYRTAAMRMLDFDRIRTGI